LTVSFNPDADADDEQHVDWDGLLAQLASQPPPEGWVSLEEAATSSGVSRSTLRSWYRNGQIPSRMVPGTHGPERLVPLEAVLERALGSSRLRRQLEQARSASSELADLRNRIEVIERFLGIG
jgi:transposase